MFDIGGWEFLLIAVIAIVVIGPKDLPGTIRTITGWIRQARSLAGEFRSGLDDIAREADIDSVKDDLKSDLGLDDFADTGNSIRDDIERSMDTGESFNSDFNQNADGPEDDPFLKDYLDGDEDDELDDIDPKYRTSKMTEQPGPDKEAASPLVEESDDAEPAPIETVKKA